MLNVRDPDTTQLFEPMSRGSASRSRGPAGSGACPERATARRVRESNGAVQRPLKRSLSIRRRRPPGGIACSRGTRCRRRARRRGRSSDRSPASSSKRGSPPWKFINSRTCARLAALIARIIRTSSLTFDVQRLVAGDHDRRRPAPGLDAEHAELHRQQRRIALGLGDVRIHAAHVGLDDRLAARVIAIRARRPARRGTDAAARRDRASARAGRGSPPPCRSPGAATFRTGTAGPSPRHSPGRRTGRLRSARRCG